MITTTLRSAGFRILAKRSGARLRKQLCHEGAVRAPTPDAGEARSSVWAAAKHTRFHHNATLGRAVWARRAAAQAASGLGARADCT